MTFIEMQIQEATIMYTIMQMFLRMNTTAVQSNIKSGPIYQFWALFF